MSSKVRLAVIMSSILFVLVLTSGAIMFAWPGWIVFVVVTSLLFSFFVGVFCLHFIQRSETRLKVLIKKSRSDASRHEFIQEQLLQKILSQGATTSSDVEGLVWRQNPLELRDTLRFSNSGQSHRTRVLFVTSNGAGMGHLTRLMAIAKYLEADAAFVSLSSAAPVVREFGYDVKYFVSQSNSGLAWPLWNRQFARFIDSIIRGSDLDAVIFDGTWIYRGLYESCFRNDVPLIWSRRGLWKEGADTAQSASIRAVCDFVISPGDIAAGFDKGPLINFPAESEVDAITIVDRADVLGAVQARSDLGLSQEKRYVLIQLGAGQINDILPDLERAVEGVKSLGPEWEAVVGRSPLSSLSDVDDGNYQTIRKFPIAAHLSAFEFGIFAAGYNTVHESIVACLPSIFVPNFSTSTDNQELRASAMEKLGLGLLAETAEDLKSCITKMANAESRANIVSALEKQSGLDGAAQFASEVARFLTRRV